MQCRDDASLLDLRTAEMETNLRDRQVSGTQLAWKESGMYVLCIYIFVYVYTFVCVYICLITIMPYKYQST